MPTIALTYANDKMMDGAGAQLQRIYGIYSVSRYLGLPYIHSPLIKIGYQGLSALEENHRSLEIESRYNRIFDIRSDITLPESYITHEMYGVDHELIEELKNKIKHTDEFHLLRIVVPYAIADNVPDIYNVVKWIVPFEPTKSRVFRVAIHVRRGELFVVDSDRMLPNSYYLSTAMAVTESLQEVGIQFVCELYTEVPSKPFLVTPGHHGIENRISEGVMVDPKMNAIEEFDVIPNLSKLHNIDPIETLRGMATADLLIMSRSSFSYVGAILNPNGAVIYHPFWHSPMKEWLILGEDRMAFKRKLVESLHTWKASDA
jgi:hypothetical protein